MFSEAYDASKTPQQFVDDMRNKNLHILGIGHLVKNIYNPDSRVEQIKKLVFETFVKKDVFMYALQVEKITVLKKDNLILNVDGACACAFVDLLRYELGVDEALQFCSNGGLNGFFMLSRTIGFCGHYFDQKRLKQGLYRHPWQDVLYMNENQ
jgi:ATP citrate (pro-S)-lyase